MYLHKRHNIIFTIFIFPGTLVFYLVDESEETGKGANSVISMLTAAELFTGNLNNFRGIFNWTSLIGQTT
jgi:hypothetical protein